MTKTIEAHAQFAVLNANNVDGYTWNFAAFSLFDLVEFEESEKLAPKLDIIARLNISNPYGADLKDRESWRKIPAADIEGLVKAFSEAMTAAFQG